MGRSSAPILIHKNTRHRDFTSISNCTLQNSALSLEARGMLGLMLSMPDDWRLNEAWLISAQPAGKAKVRVVLRELERHGYLTRRVIRGARGRIECSLWEVWDQPRTDFRSEVESVAPQGEPPRTDFQSTAERSTAGQSKVNRSYYKETGLQRNKKSNSLTPLPPSPRSAPPVIRRRRQAGEQPQPNSPQPAAAAVRDQDPEQTAKRKANPSRLLITADDLPLDLLGSAVADYVTWWNKVRQGQCTERTLKAELNQLRKIAADPAGGIAAVEAQIRQALEKADLGGKRWSAITHANWQRYGVDRRTHNGPSARIAEARRVSEAFGGRNPLHVYGEARQAGTAAQIDLIQPVTIAEIR